MYYLCTMLAALSMLHVWQSAASAKFTCTITLWCYSLGS